MAEDHEFVIYYSPDWCDIYRTDSCYGGKMMYEYDLAIKKTLSEQGDLVAWNNGWWWVGNAVNCGELFEKFSDILKFKHFGSLSSKLIKAYLDGFYGTMYGAPLDEIIHIDAKEARIVDGQKLYFAWGWPGPDVTIYRLKDYGKTWALTREELNKGEHQ